MRSGSPILTPIARSSSSAPRRCACEPFTPSSAAINASAENSLSLAGGSDTSISIFSVAAAAGQRKPGITLTANKLAWNSVHEGANRWPPIALMSVD
jgi:hypothetical protein